MAAFLVSAYLSNKAKDCWYWYHIDRLIQTFYGEDVCLRSTILLFKFSNQLNNSVCFNSPGCSRPLYFFSTKNDVSEENRTRSERGLVGVGTGRSSPGPSSLIPFPSLTVLCVVHVSSLAVLFTRITIWERWKELVCNARNVTLTET